METPGQGIQIRIGIYRKHLDRKSRKESAFYRKTHRFYSEFIKKSKLNLNIDNCQNNKQIEDHILTDRINGVKKFKIESTPTLIINGKKFEKSLNYKNLKKTLEKLI